MKKLAPAFLVILSMISCAPSPTEEPMMETEISMTPKTPEPEDTSTTATDSETTADEEISIEMEDMTITSPPTGTNSSTSLGGAAHRLEAPIILAYFPSWSEDWVAAGQPSKLRNIPPFVNHVFLGFAKPNMRYERVSYDLSQTGIEVPYGGCELNESVSALRDKGINVILSLGGETYWRDATAYDIDYSQIKDLVDDIGFAGIDWDYEPDGSFTNIGNAENTAHFIDFFEKSRALMPKSEGYLLACAPAGVGAIGGQFNDDAQSPFRHANRNMLTGENDDKLYQGTVPTNGINLFGFSSTGHMIPVFKAVGDKIDIVAFQGYNTGASTNRSIMYDAYAHYAEQYGFTIAAGIHFPEEPWGPFYTYTHENVAALSEHIRTSEDRKGDNDGIMIWQLLLTGNNSSAYSYLNVASNVLNGSQQSDAIGQANNVPTAVYAGGGADCSGAGGGATLCELPEYKAANQYPEAGTQVVYNCMIWQSKWWVNPNEIPGENDAWEAIGECKEGEGCGG